MFYSFKCKKENKMIEYLGFPKINASGSYSSKLLI